MTDSSDHAPLAGRLIGVTAARKAAEQIAMIERRGGRVEWAPTLSAEPVRIDPEDLRAATERVVAAPVDVLLATTGTGVRAWFDAAASWGLRDPLLAALAEARILARGPKTVGALRGAGLRELWHPESESLDDVLAHLRPRDLQDLRVVLQEHGQPLPEVTRELRSRGAEVEVVSVYRNRPAPDREPILRLLDLVAYRVVDAVTFTAAPAVASFMDVAEETGRRDAVVAALSGDVVAVCVGPVTAAAFERWGVPTVWPDRSRTGAMVRLLESALAP